MTVVCGYSPYDEPPGPPVPVCEGPAHQRIRVFGHEIERGRVMEWRARRGIFVCRGCGAERSMESVAEDMPASWRRAVDFHRESGRWTIGWSDAFVQDWFVQERLAEEAGRPSDWWALAIGAGVREPKRG